MSLKERPFIFSDFSESILFFVLILKAVLFMEQREISACFNKIKVHLFLACYLDSSICSANLTYKQLRVTFNLVLAIHR